ncbi:hypothetical protein TRVL_07945 [Trypanosoma vivax]|nr:hypothetical protein TRVL_07945 [Trypanosoma vivax]
MSLKTECKKGCEGGSHDTRNDECIAVQCSLPDSRGKQATTSTQTGTSFSTHGTSTEKCDSATDGSRGEVNLSQQSKSQGCPHDGSHGVFYSVVQRTPFRALNGRAYAVPITMIEEFDAIAECIQSSNPPPSATDPVLSPLCSPGVIWRHDPYSTKIFAGTLYHSVEQTCPGKVDPVVSTDDEKRTVSAVNAGGHASVPCGVTVLKNGTAPLHLHAPLEASTCCSTTQSNTSGGTVNGLAQPCNDASISKPKDNKQNVSVIHGAEISVINATITSGTRVFVGGEQQTQCAMPVAQSVPTAPGRCVIFHPAVPVVYPPPVVTVGVNITKRSTVRKPKTREGGSRASHRTYTEPIRGPGSCPAMLPLFRSLPSLFADLSSHTNRRPPFVGGRLGKGNNKTQSEDVRYVSLVSHRCRRSVCVSKALYMLHEVVVLEGDMGIEMGVIHAVLPVEEFDRLCDAELTQLGFPAAGRKVVTAAFILRRATDEEKAHYNHNLVLLAKDLLTFLRHCMNPTIFLDCRVENMMFLDCEFQADCQKIYVYYRAKRHVFIRELAQYLHGFYRCRIWLHELKSGEHTTSGDSSYDSEG